MSVSFICRSTGIVCPHAKRLVFSKLRRELQRTSQWCVISSYQGTDFTARSFSTTHLRFQEASDVSKGVKPVLSDVDTTHGYRERYIPITRQSIIRYLIEEKDFLSEDEKKFFPEFSCALDRAFMNQYKGVLGELKTLFDPINPDKDTLVTREFSRREKLDNEFWLLQQLNQVMKNANFQELPKPTVEKFLSDHMSSEGVRVSVDSNRYDVLRFWVLGHERPAVSLSIVERLTNAVLRRPPRKPMDYYKRVVVAIRLKKDSKLVLKAFKEVPVQNIEMLLPDGTIKMSTIDKGILTTSVAIAGFGILAKVVTYLAALHVEWTLMLASITGLIGFRAWTMYKNRRNEYLIKVTQMLYYKNIANNRSLLTLLVDRAEDECFKEALLSYVFLLTTRPAVFRHKPISVIPTSHLGGLTVEELEKQIEEWMETCTGMKLHFDSSEALPLLRDLGLVTEKDDKLHAVMLDVARTMLPAVPPVSTSSSSSIVKENDVMDGFDRDVFLETEDELKSGNKKRSKYGWF